MHRRGNLYYLRVKPRQLLGKPPLRMIAPVGAPEPDEELLPPEPPEQPELADPAAATRAEWDAAGEQGEAQALEAEAHGPRQPQAPSPAEKARHELLHMPFAAWCPDCVLGRGRDAPHQRDQHKLDAVRPILQMDYFFQGDDETFADTPAIICVDTSAGAVFATQCTQKGSCPYTLAALSSWVGELGHARIILQSDGEPAIMALAQKMRGKIAKDSETDQISLQAAPRGSHQSNGAAERAVQTVRGLMRTLLLAMTRHAGVAFWARFALALLGHQTRRMVAHALP